MIQRPWLGVVALGALVVYAQVSGASEERPEAEQIALRSLRQLGAVQLAYREMGWDGTAYRAGQYGSFASLIQNDLIQQGYSRDTLIPDYSLSVFFAEWDTRAGAHDGRFTIVASPDDPARGLRTFALCDDQALRVATNYHLNIVPNPGNMWLLGDNPCLWQPVEEAEWVAPPAPRTPLWEQRAVEVLRNLGVAQLAYRRAHPEHVYGSYWDLLGTEVIPTGLTRGNMIEGYSLGVFAAGIRRRDSFYESSFTIVALPRSSRNRLRTFALCDDQTLRVATDFNLNIVPNAGWQPLPGENTLPTGDSPCEWVPLGGFSAPVESITPSPYFPPPFTLP